MRECVTARQVFWLTEGNTSACNGLVQLNMQYVSSSSALWLSSVMYTTPDMLLVPAAGRAQQQAGTTLSTAGHRDAMSLVLAPAHTQPGRLRVFEAAPHMRHNTVQHTAMPQSQAAPITPQTLNPGAPLTTSPDEMRMFLASLALSSSSTALAGRPCAGSLVMDSPSRLMVPAILDLRAGAAAGAGHDLGGGDSRP